MRHNTEAVKGGGTMLPTGVHDGGTVGDMIVTALTRHGQRTAFVTADAAYTYDDVSRQVRSASGILEALGLRPGETVAQISRNSPEQWFVMAAAYLRGFRSVTLHAAAGVDDQVFIINDADAQVVVVDPNFSEQVQALRTRCPSVRHWLFHGPRSAPASFWAEDESVAVGPLESRAEAGDIVRIGYTGGTTGQPKGVMLSSRSLLWQALLTSVEKDWPERPVIVISAPISHGAGGNIIPVLARGGTVIMLDRFSVDGVLDAVEEHRASVLHLVPTMLYALLDHPRTRKADLSSLKSIMYGASPASPTRIREAMAVFGPILCQGYGQTEAPSCITVLRQSDHDSDIPNRLSSCGLPYPGIQVRLLDEECQPVETGSMGEICVRGPLVMDGYLNQPELTAAAMQGGWLHTGDIAVQDELGYIYIVDRKKDVIISGGFNVYPNEIENVLATHPGVVEAAVIGVPHPKWGEAVKAIIVSSAAGDRLADELISLCKAKKGSVQAPKSVEFVAAIPRTAVGKPDKAALRKLYGEGQTN